MSSRRAAGRTPITRFTKVKFDGSKVRLEYQVTRPGGGDPDEFALQCSDLPLQEFVYALRALIPDVLDICEFPLSEASKISMRGVSLAYKDGVMGCVLTALRELASCDAPLILNSPYLPEKASSDSGGCLQSATVHRIRALCVEAERYLNGERLQGTLFKGEAPDARPVDSQDASGAPA